MNKRDPSVFLLGLGLGIGISMLLAPKSGKETRELIKDRVGEETAYLKQRGAVVRQAAAGCVDKSKEYINSFSRRNATQKSGPSTAAPPA